MSKITRVEIHEFEFDVQNLARDGVAQTITYCKGASIRVSKYAIVVTTADGNRGE